MRAEPRPVPTSLWACLGRGFGVQWERVLLPGDLPCKPLAPTSTGCSHAVARAHRGSVLGSSLLWAEGPP